MGLIGQSFSSFKEQQRKSDGLIHIWLPCKVSMSKVRSNFAQWILESEYKLDMD